MVENWELSSAIESLKSEIQELRDDFFYNRIDQVRIFTKLYENNIHAIKENETLVSEIFDLRRTYFYRSIKDINESSFMRNHEKIKLYLKLKYNQEVPELKRDIFNKIWDDVRKDINSLQERVPPLLKEEFSMEREEFYSRFSKLLYEYNFILHRNGEFTDKTIKQYYWLEVYG